MSFAEIVYAILGVLFGSGFLFAAGKVVYSTGRMSQVICNHGEQLPVIFEHIEDTKNDVAELKIASEVTVIGLARVADEIKSHSSDCDKDIRDLVHEVAILKASS